MAQGFRG